MKLPELPFNWFDFVVAGVVVLGIFRGRKRGMSEEALDVTKWVGIMLACAFAYRPFAIFIQNSLGLQPLLASVLGYLGVALGVHILFGLLKRMTGEKMVGSDTFGKSEYYLGMIAGVVRCLCVLVFFLGLLNAKLVTDAEIERKRKEDLDLYGATYFPSLGQIQRSVFRRSFLGPLIYQHLGICLTDTASFVDVMQKREGFGGRKEREIDEIMGGPKR